MNNDLCKTILLVEDEAIVSLAQQKTLEKCGYNVITVNSGEKAIDKLDQMPGIDLILMDIDLGKGIDGPEAATIILKQREIPVVFLSSHTEPQVVEKTEKITSYGYVVKNSGITVLDASIKMAFKLFEAKRQISESELKQKAMISNISDVIVIIDSDGINRYKSSNVEQLFGWKPEELIGKSTWDNVHPEDLKSTQVFLKGLSAEPSATGTAECRYMCRDGSYKWIEITITNLLHNPVIQGFLGNYHDITGRKEIEQELREGEARFKALHNASFGGISIHDKGIILECNQGLSDMTGYSISELVGMDGLLLIAEESRKDVMNKILSRYEKPYEATGLRKNGEKFPMRLEARNVPYKGKDVRTVEFRDITELKKVETEIKIKYEELQSVNKELNAAVEKMEASNKELLASNEELQIKENAMLESDRKYRQLFDVESDAIFLVDCETDKFIDANPAALELYGYSYEEFLLLKVTDISNEPDKTHEAIADKEKHVTVRFHKKKDSTVFPVEITGNYFNLYNREIHVAAIRDITGRQRMETDIKNTLLFQQNLLEAIPVPVFYKDVNCIFIGGNHAFDQYIGFSSEQYIGKTVYDISPPDLAVVYDKADRELLNNPGIQIYEPQVVYRDGTRHEVIISKSTFSDAEGKVSGFIGVINDITEVKMVENLLRESEAKYSGYVEKAPDGVFITDEHGHYLEVNKAACIITGFSKEELLQRSIRDMLPEESLEAGLAHFNTLLETGASRGEVQFKHKDNSIRWWFVDTVRITETRYLGFTKDITERKQIEKLLLESEELFSAFMTHLPASAFIKDEGGRNVFLNKHLQEMMGFKDWGNKTNEELLPEELAQRISDDDRKAMENGPLNIEETMMDCHGVSRIFETIKFPIHFEGKPVMLGGIAIDITDYKIAREKIRKLLNEKELILKEVHHRIKNNMLSISSLLALQSESIGDPVIINAFDNARLRIMSMMVLYDKLYRTENFNELSTNDYFSSLIDEIIATFPDYESVKIDQDINDFMLKVNKMQPLGIIVNELLTNIMKYAFIGKNERVIQLSLKLSGTGVILVIADNGVGIPESLSFDSSSGFGLRLVAMLTEQIGGHIRIEREEGTRFVLEFEV